MFESEFFLLQNDGILANAAGIPINDSQKLTIDLLKTFGSNYRAKGMLTADEACICRLEATDKASNSGRVNRSVA